MRTPVCGVLGIEQPIVQAPIGTAAVPRMAAAVSNAGALGDAVVLHTVGSAQEARRAVEAGVDVIVAQGWEAGGHVWGGVATLPLVPAVVDAVAPGTGDRGRRDRRRPRGGGGARPGRAGGVAGHALLVPLAYGRS